MRKFRNVCIEWIGTCILVQIAVTFGLIWFFNNMVTITSGSARNINRCITHLKHEDTKNSNSPNIQYISSSGYVVHELVQNMCLKCIFRFSDNIMTKYFLDTVKKLSYVNCHRITRSQM